MTMIFLIRQLSGETVSLTVEFTDTESHLDTLKKGISELLGFDPVTQTIYSSEDELTHDTDCLVLLENELNLCIKSPIKLRFSPYPRYYLLYSTPYLNRETSPLCSIFIRDDELTLDSLGIDHGCAKIDLKSIPESFGLEWASKHHGFLVPVVCPSGKDCPLLNNIHHSVVYSHGPIISRKTENYQSGWLVLNRSIQIKN